MHLLAQKPSPIVEEHVAYLGGIVRHLIDCIDVQVWKNNINNFNIEKMKDVHGRTPLHMCVRESNAALALFLLSNGADYTIADSNGRSFLHILACSTPKKVSLSFFYSFIL